MKPTFEPVSITLPKNNEISIKFEEHTEDLIAKITLTGVCTDGSQGKEDYGEYLYQTIGLFLLTIKPMGVLVDLRDLKYNYGTRIMNLFQIFNDVITCEGTTPRAYIISDKNKYGLASLFQFDLENLKAPFFYNEADAYKDLYIKYDAL